MTYMRSNASGQLWTVLDPSTWTNLKGFCAATLRDESEVIRHAVSIYLTNWLAIQDHERSVAAQMAKRGV